MTKDISLSDIIRNTNGQYTEEERQDLFNQFKGFLMKGLHYGSANYWTMKRIRLDEVEAYGIFERLLYDSEQKMVHYIAGQNYPEEIRSLRKLFKK